MRQSAFISGFTKALWFFALSRFLTAKLVWWFRRSLDLRGES